MNAPQFLQELRAQEILVSLEGSELVVNGPECLLTDELEGQLRSRKRSILQYLQTRVEEQSWPPECLDSVRRFGQPRAILFPLLGKRVESPKGPGKLVRVFEKSAGVALHDQPSRVTYFEPREIWLTDTPWEPEPEDPQIHRKYR